MNERFCVEILNRADSHGRSREIGGPPLHRACFNDGILLPIHVSLPDRVTFKGHLEKNRIAEPVVTLQPSPFQAGPGNSRFLGVADRRILRRQTPFQSLLVVREKSLPWPFFT
jgi:hypothetical protein